MSTKNPSDEQPLILEWVQWDAGKWDRTGPPNNLFGKRVLVKLHNGHPTPTACPSSVLRWNQINEKKNGNITAYCIVGHVEEIEKYSSTVSEEEQSSIEDFGTF